MADTDATAPEQDEQTASQAAGEDVDELKRQLADAEARLEQVQQASGDELLAGVQRDRETGTPELGGFSLAELRAMLDVARDPDDQMELAAAIERITNPGAGQRAQTSKPIPVGGRLDDVPAEALEGTGGWREYRRINLLTAIKLARPFTITAGPGRGEFGTDHYLAVDADGDLYAIPDSVFHQSYVPDRPI
jgi:hypothetical protein